MSSPTSAVTPPRPALLVILVAQLVIPLSIAGTAVALPAISDDLGTVTWQLQGVVNGFNLAFAAMTLLWGALADRIGHDRTFRAGLLITLTASVGSMLAPSLLLLDVARIVAGAGAAAVLTGATSTLSGGWVGEARARAFAWFGSANGVGLALGPSVSGALVDTVGWRGVFGAQAAMLLLAGLGSGRIPTVRPSSRSAATRPPLLDLTLLARPGFVAALVVPAAGAVGFVTLLTYLPNALSAIHAVTAGEAGAMMLVATAPVVLAPSAVGAVMTRSRIDARAVLLVSFALLVLGALGLLMLAPERPWWVAALPMALTGLGFGLPLGLVDAEALSQAPESSSGSAAGLLNFVRIGSEAVAVAAYSAVLSWRIGALLPGDPGLAASVAAGHPGAGDVYARGLHEVLIVIALLVGALGVAFAALRHRADR